MDADLEEVRRQVLEQMEGTREVSDEQLRMKISVQTGKYGQEHLLSLQERMRCLILCGGWMCCRN